MEGVQVLKIQDRGAVIGQTPGQPTHQVGKKERIEDEASNPF
jgi:hypothetical protein